MEFHEKLQALRKQKGLTQEQLAQALFVSRTAISKWESGRGYPNIDSLKAIAKFFSVSIDDLLSGEEILTIAEEEQKEKKKHICHLTVGLFDCSAGVLFFLPFFAQRVNGDIYGVPLLALTAVAPYLRAVYFFLSAGMVMMGILFLAMQNCRLPFWNRYKYSISLAINAVGALVFINSLQTYAATFLFVLLGCKVFLLMKQR